MDLPQTLHGQLYLLAYDRTRHSFDSIDRPLLGFALRAAMLTDLYLTGHLEDKDGKPRRSGVSGPGDPVLRAEFERVGVTRREWSTLIAENRKRASHAVRDQLEAGGWLCVQRRRKLGIIPATRLEVYDEDMVGGLADRVAEALRNTIEGRQADPRHLAVGMLGVLAQMPTVFSFEESSRHRKALRELTLAAIEPILGMHQAVLTYFEDQRSSGALSIS